MQSKDRCIKIKEKYFISKYYLKTDVPKRAQACIPNRYNCLNDLLLAKQVPQFMKTLSKGNSEKGSHFSQSKPRRPYNIIQSITQTRQRRPYKISQSQVSKTKVNGTVTVELKP